MPSPPFIKIPLVFLVAWTYHISATPPSPPPSVSELSAPSLRERFLRGCVAFAMFSRVIPWIAALGETVVVLAQHNPSSSTAARILELLVRRERASAIPIGLTAPFIFGTLLAISGGLLRSWCYNTLGRFFTFQMGIRRDHRLITKGPYSFVRHPSYTGAMLCSSGVWISLLSRGSWLRESGVAEYLVVQLVIALNILLLGLICGGMVLRISAEDAMLRKEFGKEWDEWAQRVPYRLFTGIY